jgi:hypothetical protein
MTTGTRSAVPAFVIAGVSLVLAVVTGIDWLGKPLRMVNLLTIIGLSATAGVLWSQAVWRVRQDRSQSQSDSTAQVADD